MPALNTKQYQVICAAGAASKSPGPAVPERRYLAIQNTGANEGRFRFGGAVRGDGGDMIFAAGALVIFSPTPDLCPTESLNFSSTAGTTFAVLEGTVLIARGRK